MYEPLHYCHFEHLKGAWQSQIIPLRLLRRYAPRKDKGRGGRGVIFLQHDLVEGRSCAKISVVEENAYL